MIFRATLVSKEYERVFFKTSLGKQASKQTAEPVVNSLPSTSLPLLLSSKTVGRW